MQIKTCLKYFHKHKITLSIIATLCCVFIFTTCHSETSSITILPYPAGYNFAFTITDDPDDGWWEEKKNVYDFLSSLGLKTSIGVWIFDNKTGSGQSSYYHQGISLESEKLLKYTLALKNYGFEIFLHTASGGNDYREETIKGFETYKKYFGKYPNHWINHWTNYENVYWGYKRVNNPLIRWWFEMNSEIEFQGDDPDSKYFWGDYCKKYIKYVRGFASDNLNTLSINPGMPYHDPFKPDVKYWYGCSDGATCKKFNELITSEKVDELIKKKGTAIIYTHFARGFVDKKGRLNEVTKKRLQYVSSHKDGWFVPVNVILDRFLAMREIKIINAANSYLLINTGKSNIKNLALEISDPDGVLYQDQIYKSAEKKPDRLIIDEIKPGQVITLKKISARPASYLPFKERFNMVFKWIISR